jgi:hypothetical protein
MQMVEDGKDGLKAGRMALLATGEAAFPEEGDAAGAGGDGIRIGRGGAKDETLQSVFLAVGAGERGAIGAVEPACDIDKVTGRLDRRRAAVGRIRQPAIPSMFAQKHLQRPPVMM